MALDEFDVFMDPVNRRFALMFLLEFAHTYRDRQFLFFTPQASLLFCFFSFQTVLRHLVMVFVPVQRASGELTAPLCQGRSAP